ncbi:HDIG domain-containing metalloprotein [Haliangium sp.]|uniref:HDIG domain-containing metalloprotein n=1 Tax=Haliangium sp. TaxID=2663208 RepID=UPI003D0C452E
MSETERSSERPPSERPPSEPPSKVRGTRAQLSKVIRRRPKVRPGTALLLSLAFAALATPLAAGELIMAAAGLPVFAPGEPAPITVRVPQFSGFTDGNYELTQGAVVVARGQITQRSDVALVAAVRAKNPPLGPALAGYFAVFLTLGLIYTVHLRRSHRGKLLRTQAVTLAMLVGGALLVKIGLLTTSMSVFLMPLAALAIVATVVVDMTVGLSTGLVASMLVGLLVPFDLGVVAVLLLQTSAASLVAGDRRPRNLRLVGAGLVGGASAAMAYVVLNYLNAGHSPFGELADPLRSALGATVVGGLLSGLVAIPAKSVYQYLLGDITKGRLVALEDLSNPLLRQIAQNSPGTWQHSLAMANMAEIAANAIGADGRLVRVGAYYHDLGKSLQPKYFIENLDAGESSPHDRLPPEVSCDAIFAHVTEGIRVARKHKLPERIIDFMYMHHGDGLLEYFWAKCRESGNPKNLTEDDFRYPGVPPQSRETAILAVVDAVEAASRTLKRPDERAIGNLVQRIVYGKLHLGQLDQSGLSMSDLRKMSDSLRETIKHAHHGRIEYPWQREERAAEGKDADGAAATPPTPAPVVVSATQRLIQEPRLDSLDAPRPYWHERARKQPASAQQTPIEIAPTEPLTSGPSATTTTGDASSSHASLPVEIEAVEALEQAAAAEQADAATVPVALSDSQSMSVPDDLPEDGHKASSNTSADPGAGGPDDDAASLAQAATAPGPVEVEQATASPPPATTEQVPPPPASEPAPAVQPPAPAAQAPAPAAPTPADTPAAPAVEVTSAEPKAETRAGLPVGTTVSGPPPATRPRAGVRKPKPLSETKLGVPTMSPASSAEADGETSAAASGEDDVEPPARRSSGR